MSKALLGVLLFVVAVSALNDRPIFGVVTQESKRGQYFPASYPKFLESGGARTVPILSTATTEELRYYFEALSGVFFPGGSASVAPSSDLYRVAKLFLTWMQEDVDKGGYFVIIGHCLGFELLGAVVSEDPKALGYYTMNDPIPLNFTSYGLNSRYMAGANQNVRDILSSQAVTLNHHERGFSPAIFKDNAKLGSYFNVVSTNFDEHGREFVSTIEGKDYPVYALQWHAEKPQFEWTQDDNIPHTNDAITAMQHFSNFYVSEGRKSAHKFATKAEETKALLYNYSPIFTNSYFVQEYVF